MRRARVDFDAHKTVKRPAKVAFTTKEGEKVQFKAKKATKVPVHVSFLSKKHSK